MIPLLKPELPAPKKWAKYLNMSYKEYFFSNNGPCIRLLENRLQEYLKVKNKPLLVSNATVGLEQALMSFDFDKNSEVLMPSFTFSATAHSILNANLKPVLVDCGVDLFLSLDDAISKITKKTKAMVVVQSLGFSCDYKKYEKFAKENNIKIIFDSAALLGSRYSNNKMVGVGGDFEIFSLHATKPFGVGEGGLITSKSKKLLDRCRKQINFGFKNNESIYRGTNGKMSEIHGAIGNSVLDEIDEKISKRKNVAETYIKYFSNLEKIRTIEGISSYQVFPIFFKNKNIRNKVKNALEKNNIGCKIYYNPIHNQKYFNFLNIKDNFSNTDYIYETVLCIPIFESISKNSLNKVCRIINDNFL